MIESQLTKELTKMSTLSVKHFDILAYVQQAKKLGTSEELAELQARQIEQAIDIAITTIKEEIMLKDLATKKDLEVTKLDLQKEISQASNKIILWVAGLFLASGLLQHFFK